MLSSSKLSKISRKQKRCLAIVSNETQIDGSDSPTKFLGICNAGLSTGLQEEVLLEEALKFGQVDEIIMIPNKSYCFLKARDIENSILIYSGMHGQSRIGQNNVVIYLAYFQNIPIIENSFKKSHPPGLIIYQNFVNEIEEELLLKSLNLNHQQYSLNSDCKETDTNTLKHRIVKHFGYEFLYGSNQVNSNQPLDRKIPEECAFLWKRLEEEKKFIVNWYEPDQLTVNRYNPGQGIPPHVDTHSAFLDPLIILSLEGDVTMEFRKENQHVSILIPQRSLLILSKESRYDWTHGITPRFMDIIPSNYGGLTVKHRSRRTSLTFRRLRKGPCDCDFFRLCDTKKSIQQKSTDVVEDLKNYAHKLEVENVHKVYDEIANHFSQTRHSPWPKVVQFIDSFDSGSIILDIGCGNGKYLGINSSVIKIGCDRSEKLLKLCGKKKFNVFRCDCLEIPFRNNIIDGCISIAVIHHLATYERRLKAIQEIIRVLRPNGKCLIYVWAKNQQLNHKKSSYLRQGERDKNINRSEKSSKILTNNENQLQLSSESVVQLPIHVNRTPFEKQDVFVPWKFKDGNKNNCHSNNSDTYLRYYHVFEENELENLCKVAGNIEIENLYYDEGNWCIVFRKL